MLAGYVGALWASRLIRAGFEQIGPPCERERDAGAAIAHRTRATAPSACSSAARKRAFWAGVP